jgi:hypothetical protein
LKWSNAGQNGAVVGVVELVVVEVVEVVELEVVEVDVVVVVVVVLVVVELVVVLVVELLEPLEVELLEVLDDEELELVDELEVEVVVVEVVCPSQGVRRKSRFSALELASVSVNMYEPSGGTITVVPGGSVSSMSV